MQVTLKLFRFNPEVDKKSHYETYTLEADETERVLDLLEMVKGPSRRHAFLPPLLRPRRVRLGCHAHQRQEPAWPARPWSAMSATRSRSSRLLGLKVIKDLIVDMEPFFDNYKKVLPYFINDSPLPADGRERLQSPEQRARFDETTKCILCAACTTSCPSFWGKR